MTEPYKVVCVWAVLFVPVAVYGYFAAPRRSCPACGAVLPRSRVPTSRRQARWGGWTCRGCHAELDRHAHLIPPPE